MKKATFFFLALLPAAAMAQSTLTIEKIMQDPRWIGTSPSGVFWSVNSDTLYFNWNPDQATSDSLYYITLKNHLPQKATLQQKQSLLRSSSVRYNRNQTAMVYALNGDIFYKGSRPAREVRITETVDIETSPQFSFNDQAVVFQRNENLYSWEIATGKTTQLTHFVKEAGNAKKATRSAAEAWLEAEQLRYIDVLRQRKEKSDEAKKYNEAARRPELRKLIIGSKQLRGVAISPDGKNISYQLYEPPAGGRNTIIPDYVTESGYTTPIPGRKNVGEAQGSSALFVYNRTLDSVFTIRTDSLTGITAVPEFYRDYPLVYDSLTKKGTAKPVHLAAVSAWSPGGRYFLFDARSHDNKDRWILVWDTENHRLIQADHQHNEAWIAGPGMWNLGWVDDQTLYYQSEKTGYSHLYLYHPATGDSRQLTHGDYEVQTAVLSKDNKYFYITTNEEEPGQKQFYRLSIADARQQKLTSMAGANEVTVSPDGKNLAILYSYSNKPWELFLQKSNAGARPQQITFKAQSEEWKQYPWRDPALISFAARDGAQVYARVYEPEHPAPGKPAVIFVHGAGYLQNAHKWWSTYFREYMFHNFLADNGYHVIDIDYRGSSGYGRDWRTGIYRHMGGKDLTDHVDAAGYLTETYGVDPKRIGIYGGSYGGFITLMAMFTTPDVFAAGAALRSVTEWANYNHGYTSNILNLPYNDTIAFRRSSPIYFAEGLKGHLLMCHGLVDVNVHAQDIIKLTQRLIELRKENWELALYPVEDHAFTEPTSWMDEYKRIFKLFETVLKQ